MENATAIVLVVGLLPLLFATACTGKGEARGDDGGNGVKLRIDGSSGTRFSGSCTVGDGEPEEIGGEVPKSFTYNLGEKPLRCEISSVGDVVEVSLTHGGTRSVQRFGGGALNLTYENGSVSASTSSQVIRSSDEDGEEAGAADGPGDVASESRDVSGFDEVELQGVGNLSIRQTGSESLTIRRGSHGRQRGERGRTGEQALAAPPPPRSFRSPGARPIRESRRGDGRTSASRGGLTWAGDG